MEIEFTYSLNNELIIEIEKNIENHYFRTKESINLNDEYFAHMTTVQTIKYVTSIISDLQRRLKDGIRDKLDN